MTDYNLSGWRLRSVFELPQLPRWDPADQRPVDIEIGRRALAPVEQEPKTFLVDEAGGIHFHVPGAARYHAVDGRHLHVDVIDEARVTDIGSFLLGVIYGALCHQRGAFPLHASCIGMGDGALLFLGPSGAGKSTIASAAMARGHALLADDLTIVDTSLNPPVAMPTIARQKLWADSLAALRLAPGRKLFQKPKRTGTAELPKYEQLVADRFHAEPLPVRRLIFLMPEKPADHWVELAPADALQLVWENIYRRELSEALGSRARLFRQSAGFVERVPAIAIGRPDSLADLDLWVDAVLARLAGAA
jgi:hypothetical protein